MRKPSAIAGTTVFFFVAPGIVAGLVPWLIAGNYAGSMGSAWLSVLGALLAVTGLALLLDCFVRFAGFGRGTPAPVAPTERLVVVGAYRHIRNPMYVGVTAIIFGQALIFASAEVAAYGVLAAATMAAFARFYEEPALEERFGQDFEIYRRNVPAWLPRLTPWNAAV